MIQFKKPFKGFMIMKRTAFSMLELVMAIVVLGIVASLALPRLESDTSQEAGDSILSAIRYTQSLALSDNVTDPSNPSWQSKFWRFGVRTCLATEGDVFYYVAADKDSAGNISNNEAAIDAASGKIMLGTAGTSCASGTNNNAAPDIFISNKFGIKNTNMFSTCTGAGPNQARYIGFDYLGRPHTGFAGSTTPDYSTLLTADCNLTFQFTNPNIPNLVITISKETGYAYIAGQNGS